MKIKIVKKATGVRKLPSKKISESVFWQQLALKQQLFIHAKNNT